jgi:hypothetical protein
MIRALGGSRLPRAYALNTSPVPVGGSPVLVEIAVETAGVDYLSVEPFEDGEFNTHHTLLGGGRGDPGRPGADRRGAWRLLPGLFATEALGVRRIARADDPGQEFVVEEVWL